MSMLESKSSFSLALHGWQETVPCEAFLPLFEAWFERCGCTPNQATISRRDWKRAKASSFKHAVKLVQQGEARDLDVLAVDHITDKKNKQSSDLTLSVSRSFGKRHAIFMNGYTTGIDRQNAALEFLRDMLTLVSPAYGYSLDMPLNHDPQLYSVGMFGRTWSAYDEAIAWQQELESIRRVEQQYIGKFRHVFGINVLSPPYLNAQVDGRRFEDWVDRPSRGHLERWGEKIWVWEVPREQRVKIANILQFNGLLVAPPPLQNELFG